MHSEIGLLSACFFLVILLSGCAEPSVGCRDIRATNYNVTADESCEDCCQYPQLKIKFTHRIEQRINDRDTLLPFRVNTPFFLPAAPADTVTFQSINLYFSDFKIIDAAGEEEQITDRVTLNIAGEDPDFIEVPNDFIIFRPGATDYTLGTFDKPATYEALQFTVGLAPQIKTVDPEEDMTLPAALQIQNDSLLYDLDLGYFDQKYVYFSPPSASDSLVFTVNEPVEVRLESLPFSLVTGFDATLRMTVRYDLLFENIDPRTVTEPEFRSNIVSNLPNAFTLDSLDVN